MTRKSPLCCACLLQTVPCARAAKAYHCALKLKLFCYCAKWKKSLKRGLLVEQYLVVKVAAQRFMLFGFSMHSGLKIFLKVHSYKNSPSKNWKIGTLCKGFSFLETFAIAKLLDHSPLLSKKLKLSCTVHFLFSSNQNKFRILVFSFFAQNWTKIGRNRNI